MEIYLYNALVCAIINLINGSRIANDWPEFFKMTFLPWLLFNLKEVKKSTIN